MVHLASPYSATRLAIASSIWGVQKLTEAARDDFLAFLLAFWVVLVFIFKMTSQYYVTCPLVKIFTTFDSKY